MALSVLVHILRSVGLEIINSFCRRIFGSRKAEKPKIVLHKSFLVALSRTAVHILPLAVLTGLIYINYNGFYIGPTFEWTERDDTVILAIIQIAAKVQELLCVASLAAIVLQALRRELLSDGVPIGLLGSGIWFSQISSFWSADFIAALPWSVKNFRRFQFYVLLMLAGGLAVLIGPMSAVLMLPRNQNYPAAGTSFYLEATAADLWPTTITSRSQLDLCDSSNATEYAVCPSAGYQSILHTFRTWGDNTTNICVRTDNGAGQSYAPQCQAKGIIGWRQWNNFLVQSPQNMLPPVLSSFLLVDTTTVVQPHAATISSAQQLLRQWTTMVDKSRNAQVWSYDLISSVSATNAWSRVKCASAQSLTANSTNAKFPYLYMDPVQGALFSTKSRSVNIPGLISAPSSQIRTHWLPLPIGSFGDVGSGLQPTGLLVEFPWRGDSRLVMGCTAAAAWHNNTVSSNRAANYGAWSADITGMEWTWHFPGDVEAAGSLKTNRWITLDDSWLQILTPIVPNYASNNSQMNTLEHILTEVGTADVVPFLLRNPSVHWNGSDCVYGLVTSSFPNTTDEQLYNGDSCGKQPHANVELIVASFLADGLSRYNSHLGFDNTDQDLWTWTPRQIQTFNSTYLFKSFPQSSRNLPSQWITIYVVGWAYYASTTTDYIAVAIVCLYMAVAGAHVFWLLYWNHWISSSAWDTLTELLVLCKNSPPASSSRLENASAGIQQLRTYTTLVKVRVLGEDGDTCAERVILVEEEADGKEQIVTKDARIVEKNVQYG